MRDIKFKRDDVTIAADYIEREGAPVVVLSHGGGQTRFSWRGAVQKFAAMGFEAVSVDLRGHGESDWADPPDYRLESFARDLKAISRRYRGERPVIMVGASLGGMVSLLAASDPTSGISAVILVDVVPRVEMSGAKRIRAFMDKHHGGFATLDEAAVAIAEYRGGQSNSSEISNLKKNLRLRDDGRYYWHWDPRFLDHLERGEERLIILEEAAARYEGPLLLVRGMHSDIVSDRGVAALRALAPQLEDVDVAGSGHMVVGDRNDAFVSAVSDFLKRWTANPNKASERTSA